MGALHVLDRRPHLHRALRLRSEGDWGAPAVEAAVRILFLLAGVSYYKTTAAAVIDLGDLPTTAAERAFLATYYVQRSG